MKNKGFTLVELLAVIVVLVIIALIATPIVRGVIRNARKGAAERSTEGYLSAVETTIARQAVKGITVSDGIYTVDSNGNLTGNGKTYTIEVNGDIPLEGSTVAIDDYQVIPTGTSIKMGDYTVTINDSGKASAVLKEGLGGIKICRLESGKAYAVGSEYTCNPGIPGDEEYTFYVLENNEDSPNVSLIMDRNLEGSVSWCDVAAECKKGDSWSNEFGPITALKALEEKTKKWTNPQIISIDLPTYDQIYNVNESTTLSETLWLYGNLYSQTNTSLPYAYWTSTANGNGGSYVHMVFHSGRLLNSGHVSTGYGIRPVITIAKTNMGL